MALKWETNEESGLQTKSRLIVEGRRNTSKSREKRGAEEELLGRLLRLRLLQKQRSATGPAQEGQRVSMPWKGDTKVRGGDSTVTRGAAPQSPLLAQKNGWTQRERMHRGVSQLHKGSPLLCAPA